jgi:hypothetical protein
MVQIKGTHISYGLENEWIVSGLKWRFIYEESFHGTVRNLIIVAIVAIVLYIIKQ